MARPAGFEPATHGLEGHCSIQLSYERSERSFLKTEYPVASITSGFLPGFLS